MCTENKYNIYYHNVLCEYGECSAGLRGSDVFKTEMQHTNMEVRLERGEVKRSVTTLTSHVSWLTRRYMMEVRIDAPDTYSLHSTAQTTDEQFYARTSSFQSKGIPTVLLLLHICPPCMCIKIDKDAYSSLGFLQTTTFIA